MGKRIHIIFLLISLFAISHKTYGQEQWGWQAIDTTRIVCQYNYTYYVPLLDLYQKDDMRLEVGTHLSKFYSRITFEYDSLWTTAEGRALNKKKVQEILSRTVGKSQEEQKVIFNGIPSRKTQYIIYKNYPPGNIYVQDVAGEDHYEYNDEHIPQQWTIQQDTTTILGYHCQKAVCSWRGRDYEAWFTSEIPINDGPMKFLGLPGLILKVADTQNLYSFELKGIEYVSKPVYLNAPMGTDDSKFQNLQITRNELQQKQLKYQKSILRALKRDMARLGKSIKKLNEDLFDIMERDYQ